MYWLLLLHYLDFLFSLDLLNQPLVLFLSPFQFLCLPLKLLLPLLFLFEFLEPSDIQMHDHASVKQIFLYSLEQVHDWFVPQH